MSARQNVRGSGAKAGPAPPVNVLRRKCACGNQSSGNGSCEKCKKKDEGGTLRRASAGQGASSQSSVAPPIVNDVLRGAGQPLDHATRSFFEPRFQRDFSNVRLHADSQASASARAVNAAAYAVGNRIVLDSAHGDTQGARRNALLAHELAHVEQNASATASSAPLTVGAADAPEEQAADVRAHAALRGDATPASSSFTEARSLRLRRAPPNTVDAAMCEANKNPNPALLGDCNYKEPENCPTYEGWIRTFSLLKTFNAKDTPGQHESGFRVIGGESADPGFSPGEPPKPAPQGTPYKAGENFIDHPTDEWVKTCLPANLRATAYQLPADCADVAMILRHVWLAAHKRTEMFGRWTLGDAAGGAAAGTVHQMIDAAGTGTVSGMVAPYLGADGKPLRSYAALEPLLHPGDILVWWHYADTDTTFQRTHTDGHTHTVASVVRESSGKIKEMRLLQGNEPLFKEQKEDIDAYLGTMKNKPTPKELGEAPGRRIESVTAAQGGTLLYEKSDRLVKSGKDLIPVWFWPTKTLLVAAGPPRTTQRPAPQSQKGQKGPAPPALTDWVPTIKAARNSNFASVFEGMLYELRAAVEAGGAIAQADIDTIGGAVGAKVKALDVESRKTAKQHAGTRLDPQLDYVVAVIWDFLNSRDIATSRHLDSPYDVVTSSLLKHLYALRAAIIKASGGWS